MIFLLVSLLAGLILFWHIPAMEHIPPYRQNDQVSKKMSVIIPARNEEKNLQQLLESVHNQSSLPFEIFVVNDQSEDRTKEVAESFKVKVLDNPPLPDGWLEKSWACWNGAKEAKGEWLAFLDADTMIEKNGLARIAENLERTERKGILAVHPFHKIFKPYESLSALFHLIIFGSFGAFYPFAKSSKPKGAFGQCLICRKDEYFLLGGHEAIKSEVVENMAMGKMAALKGKKVFSMSGKKAISMRMYPNGLKELFRGWAKSFASAAGSAPLWCLALVIIWIGGVISFIFQLPKLWTGEWLPVLLVYVAFVIQLMTALSKTGSFRLWHILLFPIHGLFFIIVFLYSLFWTYGNKNAEWKGRKIILNKKESLEKK
ncbi:glycosyltransferase [Metabacillus sp. RGM 3146]|uniref:glycosyltransferase n=1 Tax=Metabacillus sp. RGM 3146 TaxID=3401092 RepID=UPI003B991166